MPHQARGEAAESDQGVLDPSDEFSIRNLVARYHHAVFDGDEATWRAAWTEDCTWWLGPDRPANGIEAAVAIWRESLSRYAWVVQIAGNGEIRASESGASGRWLLQEYSETLTGRKIVRVARYDDRYVKVDGAWRFAERLYQELHQQG